MREQVGGIFSKTIKLTAPLSGREIRDLVKQVAREQYHEVRYYHDGDCFVIGRISKTLPEEDVIVTNDNVGGDMKLWRDSASYQRLVVWDGLWDVESSPSRKQDFTIQRCLSFAKELKKKCLDLCFAKAIGTKI